MITAVLNVFKRQQNLTKQISAIQSQSVKPDKLVIWRNDQGEKLDLKPQIPFVVVQSSENLGVWARFTICREFKSSHYYILDDDTIPGKFWLENCLKNYESVPGVYASHGFIFKRPEINESTFRQRDQIGARRRFIKTMPVDWPGHSWFFDRETLLEALKIETCGCIIAGEDAHLAFTSQQMGRGSFVPAHGQNRDTWGSTKIELGEDKAAAWRIQGQTKNMVNCINYYQSLGWKFLCEKK